MAQETLMRKRMRRVEIGAMRDRIVIQDRSITEPFSGASDFDEEFSDAKVRWAAVNTTSGRTFFSGSAQRDLEITHEILLRHDPEVTTEHWIQFQSERLDIVKIEPMDARKRFMKLLCTSKGFVTAEASKA